MSSERVRQEEEGEQAEGFSNNPEMMRAEDETCGRGKAAFPIMLILSDSFGGEAVSVVTLPADIIKESKLILIA